MKETILLIIFLSIIFIFIIIHSSEVSYCEAFNGDSFLVRNLNDKKDAANLLLEIRNRLKNLINCIQIKYEGNSNDDILFIKEYLNNINSKFNNIKFRETNGSSKFTSYSINKGEEIVFCLRSKNKNTMDKLHDINELMYVAIHEIAHVGCPEIGHTQLFKKINQILLKYAIECNLYSWKNYNSSPLEYCGIELNNNILY